MFAARCWLLPFVGLTLAACGETASVDPTDTTTETGAPPDMAPELSDFEAVFTVSEGPFEIRSTVDEHIAFPDITRLSTGEILLVYREATKHAVDPLGRLVR